MKPNKKDLEKNLKLPTDKIKCTCPCHQDKNVKHIIACCKSGYKDKI
jgi:hypothetical protein